MGRLIIISNRLPISVDRDEGKIIVRQSSGGLVSAIKSYFEKDQANAGRFTMKVWVGVADFLPEEWEIIKDRDGICREFETFPLFLKQEVYDEYYNGFSNSVIWPLFHYFPNHTEYKTSYFEAYQQVNKRIAEQIYPFLQPGDTVWVHDYQLMLLPQYLRIRDKNLKIGFFLHIPFPSYEIFRLLPAQWKRELLEGILGADLIGFHTFDYVQHFMQSARIILGVDNNFMNIQLVDRMIKVDLFPIGIDYGKFESSVSDPEILQSSLDIKKNFEGKRIIFSVDRLDYSKGLMQRLSAIEYFFNHYTEWRERVVFILNIVPSRDRIKAYNEGKRMIEEIIGSVNGKYSTISWQPVIYRYNHLTFKELIALYMAADAALITPLRDGMNLVAKEYVASCVNKEGVLILSDLTGAASELSESLLVNPIDMKDVADAINRALTMSRVEQGNRLLSMQKRLQVYDVFRWVNDFLDQLDGVKKDQQRFQMKFLNDKVAAVVARNYRDSCRRCLLLDYDGTLVPFTSNPSMATPGPELERVLHKLSSDPNNEVVIISGRDANTLENWFGSYPLSLVAEHGASFKRKSESWQQLFSISDVWKDQVRPVFEHIVTRCSGSFIEEKVNTIAWHYRNTDTALGFSRSRDLLNHLTQLIQNTSLQVIDGNKVVEVRIAGLDKGAIALRIIHERSPDFILCMGDDVTDEDMFRASGNRAYTIKVGYGATEARHNLLFQRDVIPFLNQMIMAVNEVQHAGSQV